MKFLSLLVKLGAVAVAIAIFGSASVAQQTATEPAATADVVLETELTIQQNVGLNFGTVLVSSTNPSDTVVLTPAGGISAGSLGLTGTATAGVFEVDGPSGTTATITLPASATLTNGASDTLTVDTFTEDAGGAVSLAGTPVTFNVGASLQVGASQPTGTYSGTYTVQVDIP